MILHIVLNSLFVFLVLSTLTEFYIFAFRIRNARLRYLFRSLPIVKLPFDLLIFSFVNENLFINLNPFSCEMYLQDFIISLMPISIQADLSPNEHFLLPAYIANLIHPFALNCFILTISVVAIALLGHKLFQFLSYRNYLKEVLKSSIACNRTISNESLQKSLKKLNVIILISPHVYVPLAANQNYIFFPPNLIHEFSQKEFEAVVAHELEHLWWKDPILKLFNSSVCALFWWIPTCWWMKRMESDQEQASDSGIQKYGIETYTLASALMKVVAKAKYLNYEVAAICPLASAKSAHIQRFEKLLNSDKIPKHHLFSFNNTLGMVLSLMVFISFWIC